MSFDINDYITPVTPVPVSGPSVGGLKYRWECPDCRARGNKNWHGRWYTNGNYAQVHGERHYTKYKTGHLTRIVNSRGRDEGPAC